MKQASNHYNNLPTDRRLSRPGADHRLVGLVVKASASGVVDRGLIPACAVGIFSGSSHKSGLKTGTPVVAVPGVIGSALGLVGPVSVYCDLVR